MADAHRLFAPIARAAVAHPRAARRRAPAATCSSRSTARRTSRRSGSRASSPGSTASTSRSSSRPIRARGRRCAALGPLGFEPIDPVGYLDFTALAAQRARRSSPTRAASRRRPTGTGVPCVTLRPSTEWVDTVEAGANVLVDDDPDAIVARRRQGALPATARRSSTATATRAGRIAAALYATAPVTETWDVAIIGAGYVGLPLAQTFADAGQRVLLVDVVPELVEAINARREPHRGRPLRARSRAHVDGRPDHRDARLRASSSRPRRS